MMIGVSLVKGSLRSSVGHLEPLVHRAHHDVQQDQVRVLLPGQGEPALAVLGVDHAAASRARA
jgi:hypothetical protein